MQDIIDLNIHKDYYRIDEVAKICNTTIETIIHNGANDRLEIVASPSISFSCFGKYEIRKRVYENGQEKPSKGFNRGALISEGKVHPSLGVGFFVCTSGALSDIEFDGESCAKITPKIYYDVPYRGFQSSLTNDVLSEYIEHYPLLEEQIASVSHFFYFCDFYENEITVPIKKSDLFVMREGFGRFIHAITVPTPEPQKIKDLNPTERDALHNIIKALANMVIDPTAPKEKEKSDEQRGKPPFKNQTQLIEFLSDKESGLGEWRGLSRPNLEKVFAKANKTDSP